MKRLLSNITAAAMLMCSITSAGIPAAAKETRTDILDRVKFVDTAYSVYAPDTLTQSAFEMDGLFTESHQSTADSPEELDRILSQYLLEAPRKEFMAQYPEEFFYDYTLMLCTYMDPTRGRLVGGHKLQSAELETQSDGETVLYLDYTSTFGASVCKTHCFEILQVIVPNRIYPTLGWEWHCTESLEPGLVRFRAEDADTGETLNVPGDIEKLDIQPVIGYYDAETGDYAYSDMRSIEFQHDLFWDGSKYLDADLLDFELNPEALPGFVLPGDYRTVTRYENGSMDVVFRLRRDIPEKGMLRVWLKDADTGALIVSRNQNGGFGSICTNISFNDPVYGTVSTGPILMIDTNPCVQQFDLMFSGDSYEYRLSEWDLPRGYRSNAVFSDGVSIPEGAIEATRYENGSADIVFRLKFTPTGDVSGDGQSTVSDAVSVQKWLLGEDTELADWKAADYNNDNRLNAADLTLMLRAALSVTP